MTEAVYNTSHELVCTHCGGECVAPIKGKNEAEVFCCLGCQSVYEFLKDNGLSDSYYRLLGDGPRFGEAMPAILPSSEYSYIDQSDFLSEYATELEDGKARMTFYIEGIHCLACLWLLEKIPDLLSGVKSAKLDLGPSHLSVVINVSEVSFSEVATLIAKLGHRPHPIKDESEAIELKKREDRATLVRIGLAAFCAGNIMVYNAGIYTGATGLIAQTFGLTTTLLALPAMTYCAYPFYKSALAALRTHQISIDIPISIGLVFGGLASLYNVLTGNPDNYFDTLTTLVFLVLFSRYALSKLTQKGLDASEINSFIGEGIYNVRRGDALSFTPRHAQTLRPADLISVGPGAVIPADAKILSGHTSLHYALLTGETTPILAGPGSEVERGAINLDDEIIIEAQRVGTETKIGQMLAELRDVPKSGAQITTLSASTSRILTFAVPTIAIFLLVGFGLSGQWQDGMNRALSLLVITCPCALGLSIPLAFSLGLKKAQSHGLLVKDELTLEKIMHLRHVAFDKTGTLTEGKMVLSNWEIKREAKLGIANIAFALEKASRHPIGISLCEAMASEVTNFDLKVEEREERPGLGVSGVIGNKRYEISAFTDAKASKDKKLVLTHEGETLALFTLSDRLRKGVKEALSEIASSNLELHLLSGDQDHVVTEQTKDLPLKRDHIHAELLPGDKARILSSLGEVMMVGDGVNDAYALKAAFVGVAVKGSADASIRSCDAYSLRPGLAPIAELIKIGRQTSKTVKANIGYSALYNAVAISAACFGLVSPLAAAIFMPLSSLSSFLLTMTLMKSHTPKGVRI